MAIQFHPLPEHLFPDTLRASVARLNRELRDLFGLEGVLRSQTTTRRSDLTVVRSGSTQVDSTRVTETDDDTGSGAVAGAWTEYTTATRPAATAANAYVPYIIKDAGKPGYGEIIYEKATAGVYGRANLFLPAP